MRLWQIAAIALASGCTKAEVYTPEPISAQERQAAIEDLPKPMTRGPEFYRGVSLGLFASAEQEAHRSEIYRVLLDEIRAIGATDVQLVVRWSQETIASTALKPSDDDRELIRVIARAHELGLRVFLMPIVHLEQRAAGVWRGTIVPTEEWWRSYTAFILHYARIAEEQHVELFSVGSELVAAESKEAEWRALIASVRKSYRGRLTYSANWDHFEPVRIWDAVDVIGVTAYQPLDKGWGSFPARLRRYAIEHEKPYLFTEVGYPSHASGAIRPWDHRAQGPVELAVQTECYRSLYTTWSGDEHLAGVFVWNWFGRGGREDAGYTPRGKPSSAIIELWFGASR